MIKIKSQNGIHQFDEDGNAITTWDSKKCNWIVNEEYENEIIDWYGEDSDFPAGYTLKEFEERHPNWNNIPDIYVTWFWNTKEKCISAFGLPHTFLPMTHENVTNFWDIQTYPYYATRYWGDIEVSKEKAIEHFGKYCNFNTHSDRVVVKYNDEIIHDGILQ